MKTTAQQPGRKRPAGAVRADLKLLERHEEKIIGAQMVQILTEERVAQIERECKLGWYHDGNGLYIQIPPGSMRAFWFFKYQMDGRKRSMSLGPTRLTTLVEARAIAEALRRMRRAGFDPREERDRMRQRNAKLPPELDAYRSFMRANGMIRGMGRHV